MIEKENNNNNENNNENNEKKSLKNSNENENEILLENEDIKSDNKFLENKSLISNENNNINESENLSKKNIENNIENELNNLKNENLNLKQTIKNLKKENLLLKNQIKLNKNSNKSKFFSEDEIINSKIIIKDEIKTLKNWILNSTIKFKLLMNNETSNISIENFHFLCDNKPTLILIKTKENDRIGGFTNLSWKCNEKKRDEFKKDNSTFIFSLDKKQKCFPKKNSFYTIRTFKNENGPIFGNLELHINKNFTEGECLNNKKCFKYDEDILNGKIQFKIEIFEIYEII